MAFLPVFGPAPGPGQHVGARIPYLLVGFFVLTMYSVVWQYAVMTFLLGRGRATSKHFHSDYSSTRNVALGLLILLLTVPAKLLWLSSWLYALWVTHWPGRYSPPITRPKRVMHSDRSEMLTVTQSGIASNARFRRCRMTGCNDTTPYGDRVYHCSKMDRHYPLYDHYCHWLWVAVYLDTMKPYMCHMAWIFYDAIVTCVVSVCAATMARTGLMYVHIGAAILSTFLAVYLALATGCIQLEMLCFRNVVTAERRMNDWTMARIVQTSRGDRVQFLCLTRSQEDKDAETNFHPWSLSPAENFRQLFGERAWTWPLWWSKPRRVRQYGRWPGAESDLPLGPFWRRWEREPFECEVWHTDFLPMPQLGRSTRRGEARSSGVELG